MALLNFDASQVAPDSGVLDALPAGWYNVAADASEIKPTKDATGAYLEVRLNVMDGQFKDRKLFARFNLKNNNPQAVEIAYKQLSALCHAVGLLQVQDSSQLHGRPLKVKVKLRPADGTYEASNEINAYRNINDNTVGNTGPAAPAMGAPAATPFGAGPAAAVPPAAAPQQQWQQPQAQQPWAQGAPQQQPTAAPPAWAAQPQQPAPQQFQQPAAQPQQPQQPQQQFQQPAQAAPMAAAPVQQFQQPTGAPGGAVPPWVQQPGQ